MNAELAYVFRHALLRDAAYQLQLPGDRARLHAVTFDLLESLCGGSPPDPPPWDDPASGPLPEHPTDPWAFELAAHARLAARDEASGGASFRAARRRYLRRGSERAERSFLNEAALAGWLELAELEGGSARGEALRRAASVAARWIGPRKAVFPDPRLLPFPARTASPSPSSGKPTMRLLACLALLALPLLAHAQAAGGGYKVGDRVEILYDGKWYPGTVLQVGENQWKVHYEGYDSGWDTWMPADRLRTGAAGAEPGKPKEPAAPVEPDVPVTGDPVVGEQCEASWNNSWYWVRVLKVEGGRYFIHWDGYGDEKDEWVTRDRLRRKGEAKDNLPRKGREGNGGGQAPEKMVGKDVEAYWRGRWYPATVVRTDGGLLRVRYVTTLKEGTQEEWVVKERVREPGAEAKYTVDPAKVPGKKGLSGLWYRTQYRVNFATGEEDNRNKATGHGNKALTELVFFYPDGRVIQSAVPVDRSDAGFAAWQASHPQNCGGYGIEGGLMRFEWGGDAEPVAASTLETVNADEMKLNGVPLVRAREFRAGTKLEGEFLLVDTSEGAVRWVFRKDGTFECHKTLTIGRETRQTDLQGTYELSGYDLFTWEGGKPTFQAIAFPMWDDGEPANHIYIHEGIHVRKK